uniref:hypothetical protein n=1 Tax=Roseovarius sp. BRH_c41 TaxID=1629709 RepID=UPI000A918DD6|nr:hypothetical protein [Roseovarius sp. BRH_c41]
MADFFSSDAGQYASIAKQFLEGALVLNAAQRDRGRILFRPTLALAGHGLELMLKACSNLNGQPPPTKGRKGHDIVSLWGTDVCEPVRGHVFANARLVAAEDRANGDYPDVPNDDDILPLIEEYIIALGNLHGGLSGYPLRYPSDPSQNAPRTPFLIKSLWATADDFVKRPNEFELRRFRGQI